MTTAQPASSAAFGESDGEEVTPPAFGRVWVAVGLALVGLVVAGLAWSAARGSATSASRPDLYGGSLVLDDTRQLAVVDLANGQATVQLSGVNAEVDAAKYSDVQAVPATGGTYLVNRVSGTFNLLADDDYVLAPGRGVGLGTLAGSRAATGFADGPDAYIVRYGARSTVSLVDPATVTGAAGEAQGAGGAGATARTAPATVVPRGFAALPEAVLDRAGATAVANGDLWTLVRQASGCALAELHPAPAGRDLVTSIRASGLDCSATAVEAAGGTVGLATTRDVRLFGPTGRSRTVAVTDVASATAFLPVTDASGTLWFVAHTPTGWSVFGTSRTGEVDPVRTLRGIGAGADLAVPTWSGGSLYTLDGAAAGQPALWVVDPDDGAVGTVAGARTYPAENPDERATFAAADVVGIGPRVVFNNPDSLLAVVVFTDGSHAPVVVDKSSAVAVSAAGPAQVDVPGRHTSRPAKGRSRTTEPPTRPAAPAPAFSQQVQCVDTTEKPYRPTISAIAPTSAAALVSWTYPLLDPQDCEPDTWTVHVTALGGAPQPARPTQVVNSQDQLELVGLRPTTSYSAVVSAHINTQSTPSAAVDFETGQRGPDAPTSVHTTVDTEGNWVVSWTPCRSTTCIVAPDSWIVTGSACGPAFVGQPPSVRVPAGRTSATIPAGALLGTSLGFDVHGVLADGLAGNPTSDASCTPSWRAPRGGGVMLAAAAVVTGQSVTATLQVSPAPGQASAAVYGSQSTSFVYHVDGHDYGPTSATTEAVALLAPNTAYATSVTVFPTGHPTASVLVHGPKVRDDLAWPAGITATAVGQTGVHDNADLGGGVLTIAGLTAGGSYRVTGQLACGSVAAPPIDSAVTGTTVQLPTVPLPTSAQSCTIDRLAVHDTAHPSPYGDIAHRLPAVTFTYPPAESYRYDVVYNQQCLPLLGSVLCNGRDTVVITQSDQTPLAGANWTITADQPAAPTGTCTASQTSVTDPLKVTLHPSGCPQVTGSDLLDVTVTWTLYGSPQHGTIASITGTGGTAPSSTTNPVTTTTSTTSSSSSSTSTSTTTLPTSAGLIGARTGPTALAGSSGPTGDADLHDGGAGPGDRSGPLSLEILTVAVVLAALGGGLRRRRHPLRPSKGDR